MAKKYVRVTIETMEGETTIEKTVLKQKNYMGTGINLEDEDTHSAMVLGHFSQRDLLQLAHRFSIMLKETMRDLSYPTAVELAPEELMDFIRGVAEQEARG